LQLCCDVRMQAAGWCGQPLVLGLKGRGCAANRSQLGFWVNRPSFSENLIMAIPMIKIIQWTCVGVFVVVLVTTVLSLFGLITFVNQEQQEKLFNVGIIGIVVGLVSTVVAYFKRTQDVIEKTGEMLSTIVDFFKKYSTANDPLKDSISYYIGIDLGRSTIKYSILRYEIKNCNESFKSVFDNHRDTPNKGGKYDYDNVICEILRELFHEVDEKRYLIKGIGFGLPGQIDPKEGKILNAPGGDVLENYDFYKRYSFSSDYMASLKIKAIPIAIDNDVRCATRYLWKKYKLSDAICIFSGKGLGSGLIFDKKIRYGSSFTAGEIGHTTISGCFDRNFKDIKDNNRCFHVLLEGEKKCMCGADAFHLETLVSSEGMLKIARNLDPSEYERLTKEMKENRYNYLLTAEGFSGYTNKLVLDTLTTHYLSLAFYGNDTYAEKVVRCFNEYLAIGIANYINIVNPTYIYLDGGMIRGFYKTNPNCKNNGIREYTHILLKERIRKYVLPSIDLKLDGDFIQLVEQKENGGNTQIASMGAALIFTDHTYKNYIGKEWPETPIS